MTEETAHFRLRIPQDLKKEVEVSAKANNRSINAEILYALVEYYSKIANESPILSSLREEGEVLVSIDKLSHEKVSSWKSKEDITKKDIKEIKSLFDKYLTAYNRNEPFRKKTLEFIPSILLLLEKLKS
ncbi:Arc family DNA-binding protein [Entomobacter blattae]|uniref:Arc-like DNA binding domain-containing protein n=1 Tax=Entomobacter blattae TaxID=2762277 RepID=A0A7H1NU49_9PROT|nr:Arc family DNA-binding protein [Entomobacter blattae]QNT79309.1 hypothetical protein JGUZn3_21060 [Entomobacter blattae]